MTRIRASCPECGEVDLCPDDVVLHIVRSLDGLVSDGSSYRFSCPDCEETVLKPADERIAQLLVTGGVEVEESDDATEPVLDATFAVTPSHPEDPCGGPAFTLDDVLDLHLKLSDDGWFDELLASVS